MTGEHPIPHDEIRLDDYDFELPVGQIAREPAHPRDTSRLLVVDRPTRRQTDSSFENLAQHLDHGDLLVLNNTRVVNARVLGRLERTGRRVEILFADPIAGGSWAAMVHPARRVRQGDRVVVDGGNENVVAGANVDLYIKVGGPHEHGLRIVTLESDLTVDELLEGYGHIPLPPYLDREDQPRDRTDYQTVYARNQGAIAAPTAGLHFTEQVFARLGERGVETAELTLHVGIGTFTPVRTPNARDHQLKPERFEIPETTAESLERARADGRRIVAVGTTTTRTLEYVLRRHGRFVPGKGETDLYILPGHRFDAVGGLLTNFHLPRSTLLLLVSAFAGRDLVLEAYLGAVERGYRFYSYGDATLLV
jgi:S-adenosylmethionine:tRNA ribosyltransferase-isomerase